MKHPRICTAAVIFLWAISCLLQEELNAQTVEEYEIFEVTLNGPSGGNPFVDVQLGAEFRFANRVLQAEGFYDGRGVYRIRFMPDAVGEWRYSLKSNIKALDGKTGSFTCTKAKANNHGPVQVRNAYLYKEGSYYLHYYGINQQTSASLSLPKDRKFRIEVIDAWNMTITPVAGEFSGATAVPLPGRSYMAVRARKVE